MTDDLDKLHRHARTAIFGPNVDAGAGHREDAPTWHVEGPKRYGESGGAWWLVDADDSLEGLALETEAQAIAVRDALNALATRGAQEPPPDVRDLLVRGRRWAADDPVLGPGIVTELCDALERVSVPHAEPPPETIEDELGVNIETRQARRDARGK